MKISAIINTLNEEENIENLLKTIKWVDEIIIVDMYSEDRTVEIAKNYTDKIYFHKRLGFVEPARQFAFEKASNEWILVLDADELVPKILSNEMIKISEENKYDVIYILRSDYFIGEPLKGTLFESFRFQPRFFKRDKLVFTDKIHGGVEIDEKAITYKINDKKKQIFHLSDSLHGNDTIFEDLFLKQDTYTTIEAKNNIEGIKNQKVFLKIIYYFCIILKYYLLIKLQKKNNKTGFQNIFYACSWINYFGLINAKLNLYYKYGTFDFSENIINNYNKIAEEVAKEYEVGE
ncbi:putative glycosyl transferase [Methanobrevibacter cuticularis]|uniref:Putative glycosyl transferase n=1 Tax=Methanobrevibacter cuticularis TaxID=47311 RepID=A0A166DW37_9EURY|nr:glycosyltransferase family 2 protein [Methanobrevibacter cuticularis]KZX16013.1 putative glycosyl transferase [Methanobrevibacter cuticularis]